MIVEPNAGDRVEDNLNPVGRAYYAFSTLLCTPASLSQEVGLALGAQAGEARIRDVVAGGRLHPLPPGRRDAVQPRVRGAHRDEHARCPQPSLAAPAGGETIRGGAWDARAIDARPRAVAARRYPDAEGFVERDGVRVFWERYGEGEPTVLLLPTWSIVHSRFWKAQIPYLARHCRVLTFDGRGNGRSDRPAGRRARTRATSSPPTRSR